MWFLGWALMKEWQLRHWMLILDQASTKKCPPLLSKGTPSAMKLNFHLNQMELLDLDITSKFAKLQTLLLTLVQRILSILSCDANIIINLILFTNVATISSSTHSSILSDVVWSDYLTKLSWVIDSPILPRLVWRPADAFPIKEVQIWRPWYIWYIGL